MDCRLCNYYSVLGFSQNGHEIAKCKFTNVLFGDKVENIDGNYPCYAVSLEDSQTIYNYKSQNPRNAYIYSSDGWQYAYKHRMTLNKA